MRGGDVDFPEPKIVRHGEREVYRKAVTAAMRIFEITASFPKEETYSLQVKYEDHRAPNANMAEA